MHTILGANGVIATELARALHAGSTHESPAPIRLVSRNPRKVNPTDETVPADLLDAEATAAAVAGSSVVYLVAGLPYSTAIWQDQWPRLIRNVTDACARHGSRLVFLDNVYAYGRVEGAMTEETPFNPTSRKGEVRAAVAEHVLEQIRGGRIEGLIARSADFYGPGAVNSFPHATVFQRLKAGKTPQWLGNPDAVHTFTYTPDIGRALAVLGETQSAYGRTWHLPTTPEGLTGAQFAGIACELAGRPERLQPMPPWMFKTLSTFVPVLRETREMMYQFEYDYRFDSSRIAAELGLQATSYREGVRAALRG